jgi:hypothetical protein
VYHRVVAITVRQQIVPCHQSPGCRPYFKVERAENRCTTSLRAFQVKKQRPLSFTAGIIAPASAVEMEIESLPIAVARDLPGLEVGWAYAEQSTQLMGKVFEVTQHPFRIVVATQRQTVSSALLLSL